VPKVSEAEVEGIARLASLILTAEERRRFASQLDAILAYAERIQTLSTEGVEPTAYTQTTALPLREDQSRPGLDPKEALELAPDDGDGLFKVPRVIP
jgi:aspartyl-tRNA(Asn)/glutamyl-tRNA(Gln) amidotransferase subunit C